MGSFSYTSILEDSRIEDIKIFVKRNLSQEIVNGFLGFNDDDMYNKYMDSERKKQMESGLDFNNDFFTEAEEKSIRRFI